MSKIVTVLLAVAGMAWAQGDEAAVRSVVAEYVAVRNHPDADKLKALLTSDADQLVSSGEWRRGRDSFVKGAMASSRKEAGNSRITLDAVRFVTPDVAIADGDYEAARKMRTTLVLKREANGWKIAAIRNMLPAPAGQVGK